MPKRVKFEGNTYVVPDDATDAEIAQVLEAHAPKQQAAALEQPGYFQSLGRSMGAPTTPEEAGGMLTNNGRGESPFDQPRSLGTLGTTFNPMIALENVATGMGQSVADRVKSGSREIRESVQNLRAGGPLLPNFGKGLSGMADYTAAANPVIAAGGEGGQQVAQGNYKGAAGTFTGGMIQGALAGRGLEKPQGAPLNGRAPLRGSLAARMAEIPAGEQFSRAEVLQAAREHGVNLDLAQATDSPIAAAAKKANQYSIASQGAYESARTANVNALEDWANKTAGKYSPESAPRDVVGGQIQSALKEDLAAKKASASGAFNDLDSRVGDNLVNVTGSVEAEARKIVAENREYYAKHPELKPAKAWSIMENLAERPKVNTVNPHGTAPGLMDANGQPLYAADTITKQPAKMRTATWSELHQLRSDLMDFYRNNPEIVKGRTDAWLQRMVSVTDQAMTDASAGLSPQDKAIFRQANQQWEGIKQTYDNPSSPLYHALRSSYPSQVAGMLSKATPELARQVRRTLGKLDGPFQRQFVENLVTAKDGSTFELGKLSQKLKGIPDDFLEAMVGKDGARELKLLGKVSQKISADANPSGTAKVVVPVGEVGHAITSPLTGGAELAAQYGAAKAINSPRVVDYLTKPRMRMPLPKGGRAIAPLPVASPRGSR